MSKKTDIKNGLTRRTLLQSAAVVVPVSLTGCATLTGNRVPLVRNSDPVALAMAYHSDTRDVAADNPLAGTHDVSQKCLNCVHQRGADESGRLMCPTFPGRRVSPDGWCTLWAAG